MHAHIGHALEPALPLLIEIGVMEERAAVDEIAAQIADRPLDFAFRLGAIRPTGARREAPVPREAQELEIVDERAALEPQVARDHRLHLIEEQLLRHAAEIAETRLRARSSACACPGADRTDTTAAASSRARRAARSARPTGTGSARKSTCAWRPAGVSKRITGAGAARRPHLPHERFQLRVAAGVARRPNLVEQPHGRQLGIRRQARLDDRFVGVQLRRDRPAAARSARARIEIAIEIARRESSGESCRG